jgi:hypothetical protein
MVQFYLLAVVINILGGLVLTSDMVEERIPAVRSLQDSLSLNSAVRVIVIIITLVTALFKILSVTEGDVPVLGDLVPSLSLFALGFVFFLQYYLDRSDVKSASFERLEHIFIENKSIIGIIAMVAGIVHFLFPRVLFL